MSCTKLSLSNTNINDDEIKKLSEKIKNNSSVKKLILKNNSFNTGFISFCHVVNSTKIEKLDISDNCIDSTILQLLFEKLCVNNSIQYLDISYVKLDYQAVIKLAMLIDTTKTLKKLVMNNCCLDKNMLERLESGLIKNKTLNVLEMNGCGLDNSMTDTLCCIISGNRYLTSLNICNNFKLDDRSIIKIISSIINKKIKIAINNCIKLSDEYISLMKIPSVINSFNTHNNIFCIKLFNKKHMFVCDNYTNVIEIFSRNRIIIDKIVDEIDRTTDQHKFTIKTSYNNTKFITYRFFQENIVNI